MWRQEPGGQSTAWRLSESRGTEQAPSQKVGGSWVLCKTVLDIRDQQGKRDLQTGHWEESEEQVRSPRVGDGMGYKPEALQGSGLTVGADGGGGMRDASFLVGDTRLLVNLNKEIARFLFFVSSANKPIPHWRGLLHKREENAGVCSQSHRTRLAVAPAGSKVQKTGACL